MSKGYFYIFLGLASFSMLGILHKLADVKKSRPSAINALLFFWSFLLVSLYLMLFKHASFRSPLTVAGIAVLFGISAAIAILAFQEGIRYGQIATSWLIIRSIINGISVRV